jgi:periplasmic divalent cation tolerance protein
MDNFIQVFMTTETKADAEQIARALVERRLAGCVQVVGPISSIYRWQGAVETAEEWLCLIKASGAVYAELEAAIMELHPYETPEILAMPVSTGSNDYLAWLQQTLKASEQ